MSQLIMFNRDGNILLAVDSNDLTMLTLLHL